QSRLTVLEEILESLIGIERRTEARELTHRPETSAITSRVNSSRVWRLPGKTQFRLVIKIRQAVWRVQTFNRRERNRRERVLCFGRLLQRGPECTFLPGLLCFIYFVGQLGSAHRSLHAKNSTAQQRRSDSVSKRDDSLATFRVSTFRLRPEPVRCSCARRPSRREQISVRR